MENNGSCKRFIIMFFGMVNRAIGGGKGGSGFLMYVVNCSLVLTEKEIYDGKVNNENIAEILIRMFKISKSWWNTTKFSQNFEKLFDKVVKK